MQPAFDMDALRTMVVGSELGSFARAAVKLGRSQSAVSMQLKKLEQQAGLPLFRRDGRGLAPTEAGDALLAYARRIIALNDEAATFLGAKAASISVRIGIPQDFVEDILPEVMARFSRVWPQVHLEVHAGRNFALAEDVRTGRLDVVIAFAPSTAEPEGALLARLPMAWLGSRETPDPSAEMPLPLVLYDHPCLFRQIALQALEGAGVRWRLALTTPSLPGVWAALRSGQGVSVRSLHRLPEGVEEVGGRLKLPVLPAVELRLHAGHNLSPSASALREALEQAVRARLSEYA